MATFDDRFIIRDIRYWSLSYFKPFGLLKLLNKVVIDYSSVTLLSIAWWFKGDKVVLPPNRRDCFVLVEVGAEICILQLRPLAIGLRE